MSATRKLNRDQVMELCRLSSRESLVCDRENLIFDAFVDFSQWRDLRIGVV